MKYDPILQHPYIFQFADTIFLSCLAINLNNLAQSIWYRAKGDAFISGRTDQVVLRLWHWFDNLWDHVMKDY